MKKDAFLPYLLENNVLAVDEGQNPDFKFIFEVNRGKGSQAIITGYNAVGQEFQRETFFGHFCANLTEYKGPMHRSLFTYTQTRVECDGSTLVKIAKVVNTTEGDFMIVVAKSGAICVVAIDEIEKNLLDAAHKCRNTMETPYSITPWAPKNREIMCRETSSREKSVRKNLMQICSKEYFLNKQREYQTETNDFNIPVAQIKAKVKAHKVLEMDEKIDHLDWKLISSQVRFRFFIFC